MAAASIVAHISATICSPRSTRPRAFARTRTDSATSANVRGSSESVAAPTGQASVSSTLDTAQTAHRSCVTIRSGASLSIKSASTAYSDAPSRSESRTAWSISRLESADGSIRAAVTIGLPTTSGGQRHSSETPTSESIEPSCAIISVALGNNEQMRIPSTLASRPTGLRARRRARAQRSRRAQDASRACARSERGRSRMGRRIRSRPPGCRDVRATA